MKKLKKRFKNKYLDSSLKRKLLIPTIIVIVLLVFIFAIIIYIDQRTIGYNELKNKAERISFLLNYSNVDNVWNFNKIALETTCESFFKDNDITKIEILDKHSTLIKIKKNKFGRNDIVKKLDIKRGNEKIGSLEVRFTSYNIEKNLQFIMIKLLITSIIIVIFMIFLIRKITDTAFAPLATLMRGVQNFSNISSGYNYKIEIYSQDELGKLSKAFNKMTEKIVYHQNNLENLVEERTKELQDTMHELEVSNNDLVLAQNSLWGELELAKKIQTVLLPHNPKMEGYEISTFMKPADEVGGDYYDIINTGSKEWVIIGDVSGHGVSAGLIMMMTQTSIHSVLNQNPNLDPSRLLSVVNKTIAHNIEMIDADKYMTITVFATHENGEFFFSGLHQDILIYRSQQKQVDIVETNGIWLGVLDEVEDLTPVNKLVLNKNDVMMLFSDGITESWLTNDNQDSERFDMFGFNKLVDLLSKSGELEVDDIKNKILRSLNNYESDDDITFIILKKTN